MRHRAFDAGQVSDRGHTVGASVDLEGWKRHRATRAVASMAADATEAAQMLACLGLSAADGKGRP